MTGSVFLDFWVILGVITGIGLILSYCFNPKKDITIGDVFIFHVMVLAGPVGLYILISYTISEKIGEQKIRDSLTKFFSYKIYNSKKEINE